MVTRLVDNVKKELIISQETRVLRQLQQAKISVAIFLQSGIKLQGSIVGFDTWTILLRSQTAVTQMIYKHAILTVQPQ